ncbi:MAG: ornithine--oxo-acid transaminase [Betaproteobacteria bacterium]|nr:ornithine--oxo-acid transaminase [Betaproteobacteria bacterium]
MREFSVIDSDRPLRIALIGAASGLGAKDHGCADGPRVLAESNLTERLRASGVSVEWATTIAPQTMPRRDALATIGDFNSHLASQVYKHAKAGDFPVVLGRDHLCAIGTWSGIALAHASRGPIGLIWIDAHMDSHTPADSESGAVHGMPLACLLGDGPRELAPMQDSRGRLLPENVCLIGARSFEPAEQWRLARLGVRVYTMADVEKRGLVAILEEAHAIVTRTTAGYGITLDVDVIDPTDAPGTGSPEPGGIAADELIDGIRALTTRSQPLALEIAEFNPHRDEHGRTAALITDIVECALGVRSRFSEPSALEVEDTYAAPIYAPFPMVLVRGAGVYLWDENHTRYLDMLGGYSAVSLGHSNPEVVFALVAQAKTLALTSRVYRNDKLPQLLKRLATLAGLDQVIPTNTGLEAVEAGLKAARKWGYQVKKIPAEQAEIIACEGNFHGRSIAIVAMSSEQQYRSEFGPFPNGFKQIPFGSAEALERAITPRTAAFLVEPIQGEGGICVPPAGYLARCAEICRRHNVLLICDEVQTGLGRTGAMFAVDHEFVKPDGLILGKALGGGLLPVSAFIASRAVMSVFRPGDHGSTFGGNPLAAAVALATLDILERDDIPNKAKADGEYFRTRLREIRSPLIVDIRGQGLLIGVEINPKFTTARVVCEALQCYGILSKDTHGTVIRFAPPLIISRAEIDWAVDRIARALTDLERSNKRAA